MALSLKIADLYADVEVRTAKLDAQLAALQGKLGKFKMPTASTTGPASMAEQFFPVTKLQSAGLKYQGELTKAAERAQKTADAARAKATSQNAAWQAKEVARIRRDSQARAKAAEDAARSMESLNDWLDGSMSKSSSRSGGKGKGKGQSGPGRGNWNLAAIAGTLDDLQYVDIGGRAGLTPVLNNLLMFSPALAIAGLGVQQLISHWGELSALWGQGHTRTEAEEMEELAAKTKLTASETKRLNELKAAEKARKERETAVERINELRPEQTREIGQGVEKAIGEAGGGAKLFDSIARATWEKTRKQVIASGGETMPGEDDRVTKLYRTQLENTAREAIEGNGGVESQKRARGLLRQMAEVDAGGLGSAFAGLLDRESPEALAAREARKVPAQDARSLGALQGVMSRLGLTADRVAVDPTDPTKGKALQFGMHGSSPLANGLGQALMGGLGGGLMGALPGINRLAGGKLGEAAMAALGPKASAMAELRLGTSGADFGRNLQADIFKQAGQDETAKNTEATAKNTGEMLDILRQGARNVVGAVLG